MTDELSASSVLWRVVTGCMLRGVAVFRELPAFRENSQFVLTSSVIGVGNKDNLCVSVSPGGAAVV